MLLPCISGINIERSGSNKPIRRRSCARQTTLTNKPDKIISINCYSLLAIAVMEFPSTSLILPRPIPIRIKSSSAEADIITNKAVSLIFALTPRACSGRHLYLS